MKTNRVLINLGCGHTRPDGWINTDSSLNALFQKMPALRSLLTYYAKRVAYTSGNVQFMDLNNPWQFDSASVDVVYASHVFEHLRRTSADLFLKEAFRVLRNEGVIRLAVPDLYQLAMIYVSSYQNGEEDSSKNFLEIVNLHKDNTYKENQNLMIRAINLWQGYPHQHKYMYDVLSLSKLLRLYGFTEVCESTYGESQYIPEIKQVEYTKEGVPAIYLEAKKP